MNYRISRDERPNNRSTDILISLSVGLLAGVVGGLLLAPGSGRDTRRRLGELADTVTSKTGNVVNRVGEVLREQAVRAEHAFAEGKEAYRHSPGDHTI